MRVTHIITRLSVGGAQENTIASVMGLRDRPGLQVDLISGPTSGPEGTLENTVSPEILRVVPELVRPVHPGKDLAGLRSLTRILRELKPEIVHTHSGKAGVLGRLAAKRAGVPIIIHTIHGPSFGPFQGAMANFIFRSAERYASRFTDHFVVVANAMRDQYLAAGIGRADQYSRILSGFRLEAFLNARNSPEVRARFGIQPDDIVVGKIARLFKLKGHDDLFAIAPRLVRDCPRLKFLLVGDGEWRERFQSKAREIGLEKQFIFTGLVPPGAVAELVGIMDILVHLSVREGLPRALPQALAGGKPVIAYDCDGAREVCLHGETGFLVPPGDPTNSLQAPLLQLITNPGLRARLGEQGRKFVRERFSVETMVDALHELYLRLMTERGLKPI